MRVSIICLGLQMIVAMSGCTSFEPRPAPAVSGNPHGDLRVDVYETVCEGAPFQPKTNIPVFLVVNGERRLLGHTNSQGKISLHKDEIWIPGAIVLLFCRDETFVECAALTVDTEYLRKFDEYHVEIPPFSVF